MAAQCEACRGIVVRYARAFCRNAEVGALLDHGRVFQQLRRACLHPYRFPNRVRPLARQRPQRVCAGQAAQIVRVELRAAREVLNTGEGTCLAGLDDAHVGYRGYAQAYRADRRIGRGIPAWVRPSLRRLLQRRFSSC